MPRQKEEKKEDMRETVGGVIEGGTNIYELVEGEKGPRFCLYDRKTKLLLDPSTLSDTHNPPWEPFSEPRFYISSMIEGHGIYFKAPKRFCQKPLWPLAPFPSLPEKFSVEALYSELVDYLKDHVKYSREAEYHIHACFILASYRLEDFDDVVYLFFRGPIGSGKTRALDLTRLLAFRAFQCVSTTASPIFRTIDAWHPTFILDEMEKLSFEMQSEIISILNGGYHRGGFVLRATGEEHEPYAFDTFAFKALASTKSLPPSLADRSITISMSKKRRQVKRRIDEAKAKDLCSRLLTYRFLHLGGEVKDPDLEDDRLNQLYTSLFTVAPSEQVRQILLEYAGELSTAREEADKGSDEALLFQSVLKAQATPSELSSPTFTAAQDILDEFVKLTETSATLAPDVRHIGRRLQDLNFRSSRSPSGNKRGIRWDADNLRILEGLKERYGSTPEKTSEMSETSEQSQSKLTSLTYLTLFQGMEGVPVWKIQDSKGRHVATLERTKDFWAFSSPALNPGVRADSLPSLLKNREILTLWNLLSANDKESVMSWQVRKRENEGNGAHYTDPDHPGRVS